MAQPIKDSDGQVDRVIEGETDITDHNQEERKLYENEVLFRNLFEHHTAVYLIINFCNGNIVDANNAAAKFYGWSREQLRQMRIQDINVLSTEEIKQQMEKARRLLQNHFEFRHRLADGSIRDVDVYSSKTHIKGKDLLYSVIHDITDRKQAEDALLESEEKYRKLFHEAQVAMFRTRISDGKLIDVNEEYAKMAGFSTTDDCKANFHAGKAWVDQKAREKLKKLLVENGSVRNYESEILRDDGIKIWISISVTSYPERGYLEGSISNITERKEAYDELKNMNIALDVLLKKRMQENQEIEENIFSNYELMIGPFFNKLKSTALSKKQQNLINIIETSFNEIINPFTKNISSKMMSLTQSEIQIANMIKQGFTNKEIAQTINCSKRTIDTHRINIRKKLDLTNKKVNLRTYLLYL